MARSSREVQEALLAAVKRLYVTDLISLEELEREVEEILRTEYKEHDIDVRGIYR